ncbi:sister chromatid cohesion protein pds5 like protein b-b [Quercus suber]|uniref:Sister chromatid cohesion protein pds5 like protein b-b n=1 Tax=Quercus suber TaxID=58331 RepID=A0AAW0JWV2_QUESU
MTSFDRDLEEKLKETGSTLLNPPSSIDDLLTLLDKVENLLANVEQAPSKSMQDALLPSLKALISNELLRHAEMDVKVSVASCITEITRITAPDAPYDDEQMKEIFQLTVAAFEKLSHVSSRCYTKAVSILDTVAKVRSCLVMLDLECDALIVVQRRNLYTREVLVVYNDDNQQKHYRTFPGSNHPHAVFSAMETIMTLVIDESEEISSDLLSPLLASVRKENQNVSPISWKLGEKVITNCAVKLKPYLKEAVGSMGIALDDYAQIVTSVCQSESAEHLVRFKFSFMKLS